MQNMVKYLLIIVMTLFLVGNMVSSAPPITEGYFIEDTPQTTLKKDRDFQYNFFVYNLTDGILITNESVNCIHYISNSEGAVISFENVPYFESDGHWGLTIDKGNFSENGLYYYGTKCNSSTYGGVTTGTWKVNPSGLELEIVDSVLNGIVLFLFFSCAIFFIIFSKVTEAPGVKLFFSILSYVSLILSIGASYILLQSVQTPILGLGRTLFISTIIIFIFIMYYVMVNLTKQTLRLFNARKGFETDDDSTLF
jgi:hypothetical protein